MNGTVTTASGQAFPDTLNDVQAAGSVPATRGSLNPEDTLCAPAQVSVEAGAFIEDGCPMSYDVESTMTWIVLGGPNATVNLQLSDRALINLAMMTNRAAHALLRERGKTIRGADTDTAE